MACFQHLFGSSTQVNSRRRKSKEEEEESFDVLRRGLELQAHGHHEKAKLHIMASVQARRHILTESHPSTIAAISYLGLLLRDIGEKEPAIVNLREAVEGRRILLGDDHYKTKVVIDALAALLMEEDKWEEVRDLPGYENATKQRMRKGGVCGAICGGSAEVDALDEETKEGEEEEEVELDDNQKQELLDDADDNLGEQMDIIESAHPDSKANDDKRQALREAIVQAVLVRYVTKDRVESGITIPGGEVRCVENEQIIAGTNLLMAVVAKGALARATQKLELAADQAKKAAIENGEDFFQFVPSREEFALLQHALARIEATSIVFEKDKQVKEAQKALNIYQMAILEGTEEDHVKPPHDHRHEYVEMQSLLHILESKDVRLVKPEYLIQLGAAGGIIPRRQDLPEEAFLDIEELAEGAAEAVQVISLSYCWLSDEHPDPDGYHLATIAAMLKCFMKGSFETANKRGYLMDREATKEVRELSRKKKDDSKKILVQAADLQTRGKFCFGAGDGRPVGVFMDWTSLYQEERSPEESDTFEHALKHMNLWYAHESTIVWELDYPPEVLPKGGKNVKFEKSGWGSFESRVAQMISPLSSVLRITEETRTRLLAPKVLKKEPDVYVKKQPRLKEKLAPAKREAWKTFRYVAAGDYLQLTLDTMELDRGVPLVPKSFKKMLEDMEFKEDSDHSIVNHKYHSTFSSLFTHATRLSFAKIGIDDDVTAARKLVHFLGHNCKVLTDLDMSGNPLMALPLDDWATIAAQLELERLCLDHCTGVLGDVSCLTAAEVLTDLSLKHTKIGGDMGSFAALTNIMMLDLQDTDVTGDVTPLAGLVRLKELKLQRTMVSGDVGLLCGLVNLVVLLMHDTLVSGDIGLLADLVSLEELRLDRTEVSGSLEPLVAMVSLGILSLDASKVSGDILPLLELENLRELRLEGTEVTGEEASFRAELAEKGRDVNASFDAAMKPAEPPPEEGDELAAAGEGGAAVTERSPPR